VLLECIQPPFLFAKIDEANRWRQYVKALLKRKVVKGGKAWRWMDCEV
jgi:hypothetical protein